MAEDINWNKTHCGRMDHGGCALLVGVKDSQIVDIKGDPDGYLNRGYICAKGRASADRLNHPQRLRHPLKRRGERGAGKWDPISWPQALTIIRDNFNRIKEQEGARAVAFCQGMPKGLEHFVLIRLANIFGSPNVVAVQDVCHAPREISGFHTCGFYPVADYHYPSQMVMLWGSNISATNEEGQICSRLLDQVRQGTELIVIDPRKTALAARARYWLQLKPGTDIALALAFLNVAIEEKRYDRQFVEHWTHGFGTLAEHVSEYTPELATQITGVPADLIRSAARAYAAASPAAIGWGNAIEHNRQAFDTARALVCLMAVCGNLDVPGGNIQANDPDILSLGRFVRADLIPNKKTEMIHARQGTIRGLMTVPPALFKKAILDEIPYPVRGAYMQCTNPLLGYADSRRTYTALKKLTFLAVTDIHMTPTAAMADVVLPAATHFEFDDIGHYGLGHGHILARPRVVDPPPGCWPDIKILNELGKALTGEEHWYADHTDLLEAVLEPSGLRYDAFARQGYLKGAEKFRKYKTDGFRTPTGKVELLLSRAEKLKVSALPRFIAAPLDDHEYPLILTCSKNSYYLHSSYRWIEKLRARSAEPMVVIHPQTAARHSIRDGSPVYIETRNGCITQHAHLSDDILPQVVYAAYGWWFPEDKISPQFDWQTANYNMLTTTENLGKEFGTPNLKGIPCRIRRK
jgi:anaerobic selenocysteine-containing dehydrogenase